MEAFEPCMKNPLNKNAMKRRPLFKVGKFTREERFHYLALDLVKDPLPADADEEIDLLFLSLSRAEEMIKTGEIAIPKH